MFNKAIVIDGNIVEVYSRILHETNCFEFIDKMVEQDTAEFVKEPILSEQAAKALKKNLQVRLEELYKQSLFRSLRFAVKEFDVTEYLMPKGKSLDALKKAAQKVYVELTTNGGESLKKKYPLLSEYEAKIRGNFKAAMQEFFTRFYACRSALSAEFFGGRAVTKINSFSLSGADTHRHGRSVMRVETDAGNCYYKPHDCSLDALYHTIVTKWFSDCTIAAKVISGEGYAFVQELIPSEVQTEAEVGKYYWNFGALTALFHGMGTNDMHNENILACGVYPCAVDLETLITGPSIAKSDENFSAAMMDVSRSVARIGVMPERIHLMGMVSPLYVESESTSSLVRFQGKQYNVENFTEEFIAGFRAGYDRMYAHKAEISELVARNKNAVLRVILRNTAYYGQLLSLLFRAENISSTEERDKILENLKKHGRDVIPAVLNYEKQSLLEGEIPYFCVEAGGHSLCGNDAAQVLEKNSFEVSALEDVQKLLGRLSPTERDFETEYIRRCFKHAPTDEKISKEKFPITDETLSTSDTEKIIAEILNEIWDDKIFATDGTIFWHCWVLRNRLKGTLGFVTSQSDVARYCAEILKCKSLGHLHEKAARLRDLCLSGITAQVDLWEKTDDDFKDMAVGLYDGFGGLILTCAILGVDDGEKTLLRRILRLTDKHKIYSSDAVNLADGSTGLILAAGLAGDAQAENLIRACAENLLEKETDKPEDRAALGVAFAVAYKFTGDDKYLKAAINSFERVRDAYKKNIDGWIADNSKGFSWLATRAPISANIGLCALYASDFYPADIFKEVSELALVSLNKEENIFWLDSLNQGNALSVLFLTKINRPETIRRAAQILCATDKRRRVTKNFRITEEGVRTFFEASMFVGTLGVGVAALSLLKGVTQ